MPVALLLRRATGYLGGRRDGIQILVVKSNYQHTRLLLAAQKPRSAESWRLFLHWMALNSRGELTTHSDDTRTTVRVIRAASVSTVVNALADDTASARASLLIQFGRLKRLKYRSALDKSQETMLAFADRREAHTDQERGLARIPTVW